MWILSWWRWLCGYVEFTAEGGLCERFLSLLSEAPVPVKVWNVRRSQEGVCAVCRVADYARIRPIARRTGTRVRHKKRRGADRPLRALCRRPGWLAGAVLALGLYMLLSSRVWVVDIPVEDPALCRRIEVQLETAGLARGVAVRSVDTAAVSMQAVASIEELHQLSVYFEGCVAHVDVRLQEQTVSPPDASVTNVVAAVDGRILSAQVTAGQPMFKVGEAVVEGDLLVCGAVETEAGTLFRHAAAVITAETERVIEVSVNKREIVCAKGSMIRQPMLYVFGARVPLYSPVAIDEEWIVDEQRQYIFWQDIAWPLGIEQTVYTELVQTEVLHNVKETEALARRRLEKEALAVCALAEVTDVTYEGAWDGDVYRLKGTYSCVEDIAKTVPLLTERE